MRTFDFQFALRRLGLPKQAYRTAVTTRICGARKPRPGPTAKRGTRSGALRLTQAQQSQLLSGGMEAPEVEILPQEFVLESIVSHMAGPDGKRYYRIRWYGYTPEEDTYEPIEHIPRSKVIAYYRRKRLALPPDLDCSQVG